MVTIFDSPTHEQKHFGGLKGQSFSKKDPLFITPYQT